jgi:TRAP-type C4-dicarboxylate transport system substrate-binding protein
MKPSLAAALLAQAVALTAGLAQAADLRSSDIHPDDYPTVQAVRHLGEQLAKSSGGRFTVKVFSNAALGNEKDTIEQTKLGALAMTRVNIAPMNNICPATVVPTMPFLFRSKEHMRKVLDGPIGEEILKSCEAQGFVGLAFYDSGARSLYTVKKLEAMGANATPMPFGEVYTALKTGLVDAAENNVPSYESSRHFEVAKYYAKTEHSMAPEMLLFSKRVWDTLKPADQQLLRQAAKESVPYMRKLWDAREEKSLAAIKAAGTQVLEVDKASFSQAMAPVYARFLKDPKLQDLVKRIQDVK